MAISRYAAGLRLHLSVFGKQPLLIFCFDLFVFCMIFSLYTETAPTHAAMERGV